MRLAGVIGLLFLTAAGATASSPAEAGISVSSVSRAFFNPSLSQKIQISIVASKAGSLTLAVLDRQGRVVRTLMSERPVQAGAANFDWDGRNDKGKVVPDDAYGVTAKLKSESGLASYSALESTGNPLAVRSNGYDRRTAVLSYTLPRPGRVRIEARAKQRNGSIVSRVVVRDEPRTAGAVIDVWDGYDDRRAVYMPELPGFEVSITATELPENAIVTIGAGAGRTAPTTAGVRAPSGEPTGVRR
jgi:hypothetical protein